MVIFVTAWQNFSLKKKQRSRLVSKMSCNLVITWTAFQFAVKDNKQSQSLDHLHLRVIHSVIQTGDLFISLVKKVPEPAHFSEENLSENDDNDNHKVNT